MQFTGSCRTGSKRDRDYYCDNTIKRVAQSATLLGFCLCMLACAPLSPRSGPVETHPALTLTQLEAQLMVRRSSGLFRKNSYQPATHKDTQLWFPVIAGHFFGTANAETSWPARIEDESRFSLPMGEVLTQLETMALPFDSRETGVLLEPETVRVARLKSYAISEFSGELIGETEWRDLRSGRTIILVYFDRACRLLGSLFHQGKEFRFDVSVPAPGAYWLQLSSRGLFAPSRYTTMKGTPEAHLVLLQE